MKKLIFLILIFFGCTVSFADEAISEDALKAAFIYHFIGFTEWQDNQPEYDVCIPDDNELRTVATKTLEGREINGRIINVVDRYDHCHVLVAQQSPATDSVLTIGPISNGSLMEFRRINDKLKFAVSLEKLKNSKLKISSQLLKLAIMENT